MERSGDVFSITQTDLDAFEVGRNIATAPGKVVFQNDLLQLIQYEPTTEKVHEVPLLIVPPWINKFYILDLSPQKSFIRYMVGAGLHGVRRVVGQPRPAPRAQDLRGLHDRGHPGRDRCRQARDGLRPDQRASAIAWAARCSAPRWPISPRAARTRSRRRRSLPRRSTSPRPATCCCSSTTRSSRRLKR